MTTSVKITNNGPGKVRVIKCQVSPLEGKVYGMTDRVIDLAPGESTTDHDCYVYDIRDIVISEAP